MSYTRKSNPTPHVTYKGRHRFEHWYRDNQIYLITARCRARYPAFEHDDAKAIFWDRFTHYTHQHGFEPFVTTLLNNHYHTLGHLKSGRELGPMMQKIHGSIAKLVNDRQPVRRVPFWHDSRSRDYFDGCIRDEKQFRLAYRYMQTQARRSGLPERCVQTRVMVDLETGLGRAVREQALLRGVRYARYERRGPL
jgi:hypothetical protein